MGLKAIDGITLNQQLQSERLRYLRLGTKIPVVNSRAVGVAYVTSADMTDGGSY